MSRCIRWTLISIVSLIVLWLVAEQAATIYAVHFLKQKGVTVAEIKSISVNPFSGRLSITGIKASANNAEPMTVGNITLDLVVKSLLDKKIEIGDLTVSDMLLPLTIGENNNVEIAGISPGQFSSQTATPKDDQNIESEWSFGLRHAALHQVEVVSDYNGLQTNLAIHKFDFNDLYLWEKSIPSAINLNASINESPLEISAKLPFLTVQKKGQVNVRLDTLNVVPFVNYFAEHIPLVTANLSIDEVIDIQSNDGKTFVLATQGMLGLNDLELSDSKHSALLKQFRWQGQLNIDTNNPSASLTANTHITLDGLLLQDKEQQFIHTKLDNFSINRLRLNNINSISAENVSATHFLLAGYQKAEQPALQSFEQLTLDKADWLADSQVSIGTIALKASNTSVLVNDKAENFLLDNWQQTSQEFMAWFTDEKTKAEQAAITTEKNNEVVEEDVQTENKKTLAIQLDALYVTDNSSIYFSDKSVVTDPDLKLIMDTLQIKSISPGKDNYQVNLMAQTQRAGKVELHGQGEINAQKFVGDLKLNSLDLVAFSAYIEKPTGYAVSTGIFNLDSKIAVSESYVDLKNAVFLERLKLSPRSESSINKMAKSLSMPLDYALNLLRDKKDNISLDLPIKGKPEELDVGINAILSKVMTKAVKAGALFYLKQSLQPYGTLVTVGSFVGDKFGGIHLDPITFSAASTTLDKASSDYLAKVADILRKKERLKLSICSEATRHDMASDTGDSASAKDKQAVVVEAQKPAMLAMANARSKVITDYLITEQNLDANRLISCRSDFKLSSKKPAKTRLAL